MLQIAASLEKGSEHPLGQALRTAAKAEKLKDLKVKDFSSLTGHGVQGSIAEESYFIGNTRLMQQQHLSLEAWQTNLQQLDTAGQTPIFLAKQTQVIALFAIADALKSDALTSVQNLQAQGLELIMLTGDRREVAETLAAQLGIQTVHAEVLPADKLAVIKQLQQQGKTVAMVGDGINDAPALAQADVGFAIGAGTDVAIAAADITLIGSSLAGIERAIRISRATIKTIWQNLFFAFAYNVVGIPVAAGVLYPLFGILLDPMLAGAAMALSSVTVVLNANRLAQLKL